MSAIKRARAFSLVEMLVVLVIVGVLAAFLLPNYLKGGKTPAGRPIESPMQRGHSVECMNALQQIRQAHQIASMDEENHPRTLTDLRPQGISEQMMRCPVGAVSYIYQPGSQRVVTCPQPGHERF